MYSDRELLELAAKAAGYDVVWNEHWKCFQHRNQSPDKFGNVRHPWVPLDDDGDALRLAVDVGLVVCIMRNAGFTGVYLPACSIGGKYDEVQHHGANANAATRRAIVLAAASIGRAMQ